MCCLALTQAPFHHGGRVPALQAGYICAGRNTFLNKKNLLRLFPLFVCAADTHRKRKKTRINKPIFPCYASTVKTLHFDSFPGLPLMVNVGMLKNPWVDACNTHALPMDASLELSYARLQSVLPCVTAYLLNHAGPSQGGLAWLSEYHSKLCVTLCPLE